MKPGDNLCLCHRQFMSLSQSGQKRGDISGTFCMNKTCKDIFLLKTLALYKFHQKIWNCYASLKCWAKMSCISHDFWYKLTKIQESSKIKFFSRILMGNDYKWHKIIKLANSGSVVQNHLHDVTSWMT
jgi:hypothetical protein